MYESNKEGRKEGREGGVSEVKKRERQIDGIKCSCKSV